MVEFYKCSGVLEHSTYSPRNQNCTLYFSTILCFYCSIHQLQTSYLPIINITNVSAFLFGNRKNTVGIFCIKSIEQGSNFFFFQIQVVTIAFLDHSSFPLPMCHVIFCYMTDYCIFGLLVDFYPIPLICLFIQNGTFWLDDNQ